MKFFIGLLLGIAVAGGIAYYLNNAQNPFVNKGITTVATTQPTSSNTNGSAPLELAPGTKMQVAPSMEPAASQTAKNNASAVNYDFYDVLQGKKEIHPASSQPIAQPAAYYVQAGAFSDPNLANNMKAKLALLGFSAKIVASEENNAVINKVLIGPFSSNSQAQEMVNQLNEQSVNSTIINYTPNNN